MLEGQECSMEWHVLGDIKRAEEVKGEGVCDS